MVCLWGQERIVGLLKGWGIDHVLYYVEKVLGESGGGKGDERSRCTGT